MDIEADIEVSVKDVVDFYIKINDTTKAKKALAQLSSKDKTVAFDIISASAALREFKVDMAKYFLYDLDPRIRRKAEFMLEDLVPGWVSDPAESILKLLKSASSKGVSQRNAAVKFLFGIVDSNSLRDTFLTLLSSRNRAHMVEILEILEDYIDSSRDEAEQVKIFDGCLDIVLSDDAEHSVKHHACNLLSVFFKKVAATQLGEILRIKYVERQVEKADGVHRYLCSGASGLNNTYLEDLIRPLNEGGAVYQLKMVKYFGFVLEKVRNDDDVDSVMDTYPDYWSNDELPRDEKIKNLCRRIMAALEELWDFAESVDVKNNIMQIKYAEYPNKRELLEQIKNRLDSNTLSESNRDKLSMMLSCFLLPDEDDALKLQAAHMLMFKLKDPDSCAAATDYLRFYVENRNLNYAETGSIAAVIKAFLEEKEMPDEQRNLGRYILFLAAPENIRAEHDQRQLLEYLQNIIDGHGLASDLISERVLQSLSALSSHVVAEDLKNLVQYLGRKVKKPKVTVQKPKPV